MHTVATCIAGLKEKCTDLAAIFYIEAVLLEFKVLYNYLCSGSFLMDYSRI